MARRIKTFNVTAPQQNQAPRDAQPRLRTKDRAQPVVLLASIALGLGILKLLPDVAHHMAPLVDAGVFALIYLVMLSVDLTSAARAFAERRFVAIAVVLNFIVNPLLAWLLGRVFLSNEPELRIGLIVFLVTPCIGWYLVFTEQARGNTTLGVSMLGINIVLQTLLLPVYLMAFASTSIGIEPTRIASSVVVFLVAPGLAATATRAIVAYRKQPMDVVHTAIERSHLKSALLVFTTTSRNSEASLAIAATAFASPLVALTVVIGPIIELPLLILMVRALLVLAPSVSQTHQSSNA